MSTILIVDDMATERTLIGKVVLDAGHQPVYASSGNEALEGARKHRPSLIFLDVVMPGTSGFSVCRELKKDPTTAGIPVVLVTTKSSDSDRFWGKKQGADDHVAKPFAPTDLVAMIYKHLG